MSSRDRWIVFGALGLVGLFGAVLVAVAALRTARAPNAPGQLDGGQAYRASRDTRRQLVLQLLTALKDACEKKREDQTRELVADLIRQGDAAVPQMKESILRDRSWSFRIAVLDVLTGLRTPLAGAAIEEIYLGLLESETALKSEIVSRLVRVGGGTVRSSLERLLARETHEPLRVELGKALVALGLTPEQAARLGDRDRAIVEKDAIRAEELRTKVARIATADPATPSGVAILQEAALREEIVGVALEAFTKLEHRNDAAAVAVLCQRVKAPAESSDARILQSNALAALARMPIIDARMAIREIALGPDEELRLQAIEFVGAFGDRAMLPLLEQVLQKNVSDRVAKAVDKARRSLEARIQLSEGRNP